MGKQFRWLIVAFIVLQLVVMAVAPVSADPSRPAGADDPGSLVLESDQVHELAALGEQLQTYLILNKDGTLSLGMVEAATLGVDEEFLQAYREALGYVNAAIEQGLFSVDENFQVVWSQGKLAEGKTALDESPEWTGYPADYGLYVHFSYSDAYYYIPYYGLSTALALASYVGYPYISVPYTYHFTYYYTYPYYLWYAYPCCGVWSYVPWAYLPYYSGYYYPIYRYVYFWQPYCGCWYVYYCYY